MKRKDLRLIDENEKLTGGFSVLSKEKLKRITGGIVVNGTCVNKAGGCRDTINERLCQNQRNSCADSVNKTVCREFE